MTYISAAILCGFLLDLLLADPPWMPHPVVWMGKGIAGLERLLRAKLPQTREGELLGGRLLALILPLATLTLSGAVCYLAWRIHPLLFFLVETLWCWQALAVKGMTDESRNVYQNLVTQPLPQARKALSRIVGRETAHLSQEGILRATVETVSENFTDGVMAPLFYMLLGGAPLALAYKAVNTMDSMVGYKSPKYRWFGRAAAKLDDLAAFLPSRLGALLWICSAGLTGQDWRGAWRIWRRDRLRHVSPNSGQTETACAGALGIQLLGPAYYFGEYYDKPFLGDPVRPIQPEDILQTNRMFFVSSVLAVLLGLTLRTGILLLVGRGL